MARQPELAGPRLQSVHTVRLLLRFTWWSMLFASASAVFAQVDEHQLARPDLPTFIGSGHTDSTYLATLRAAAEGDSLATYRAQLDAAGHLLLKSRTAELRQEAFDTLEQVLMRALSQPHSFSYDWTGIHGLSVQQAPDEQWKIFTWQHYINDSTYHYGGILQTREQAQQPLVLRDRAQQLGLELEYELRPDQWYGAVYYAVHPFELPSGRQAWLLFGYDVDGYYHRRKLVDVLTFDRSGKPYFGSEVFLGRDEQPDYSFSRLILEYRVDARVGLRYDEQLGGIAMDHLVVGPPVQRGGPPSYIPDGSYDGYVYDAEAGKWVFRMEWFDRVINEEVPRPRPILGEESTGTSRDLFGRERKSPN